MEHQRPRLRPDQGVDAALAIGLAALGAIEAAVPFSTVMGEGSAGLAAALAVLTALALVLRRHHPVAVVVATFVPWAVMSLLVPVLVLFWGALVPMTLAVHAVARYGRGAAPYAGAGLAAVSLLLFNVGTGMIRDPGELFFPWLVLLVAWVIGRIIHRKDARALASERRILDVEALGREQTLTALAEERARIARELHDVVAHTVTAMVVQAGAARQVVEDDPDYVRDALDRIRQTGSEALDEMRRAVTLLRQGDDDQLLSPQPGLGDLARLVERAGTPETRVRLEVAGEPPSLPVGADLAAYRVVQEALTNVHRHADASDVVVRVRYGADRLDLEVVDNGTGPSVGATARPTGSGHGLVGIRERMSLYGGEVETGPVPGGGFRVRAVLPLAVVTAASTAGTDPAEPDSHQVDPGRVDPTPSGTAP